MKKIALLLILAALTVVSGVKMGAARPATGSGTLLDVLPDGSAVAIIDFQRIAGSSLWAALNAQEKLKGGIDKAQSEMADLGIKLTDVNTVAIVFTAAGINNPTVALTGGFEQNALLAHVRANSNLTLSSEKYKDVDIYRVKSMRSPVPSKPSGTGLAAGGRDETSFAFYDASTLVVGSSESVRASVDVKMGSRPSIAQNVKLSDALAQNPAAAIRFALTLTPAMAGALQTSELPLPEFSSVSLIFGTVDVGSGIDLNATLRSDTAEHASAIVDRVNGLLTMVRGLLGSSSNAKMAPFAEALKTVTVISADADVKITASLPTDVLNSLLSSSTKK
jgi:hypothetical protein